MGFSHVLTLSIVAATALAATALAGGRGAAAPTLDPAHLPTLPAQGLVVRTAAGVRLLRTDGKVIGSLAGFSTYAPDKLSTAKFGRSLGIQALAQADPALTVLFDRAGDGWLLDAPASKLRRIGRLAVPLTGGAELVALVHHEGNGFTTKTAIERNGTRLLAGFSVGVVGDRYAATNDIAGPGGNMLVDLVTGRRTAVGPRCVLGGVIGASAVVACQPTGRGGGTLTVVNRQGGTRRLATFPSFLYPESASLSPDGKWALVYLAPGCGPGWSVVVPAAGGTAHYVTGGAASPGRGLPARTSFSYGLGWTSDGRVVATIDGPKSSCETEKITGTYLVDPATLARTKVTASLAAHLWGAAGSAH